MGLLVSTDFVYAFVPEVLLPYCLLRIEDIVLIS